MEKALRNYIEAHNAEADQFNKIPGNYMSKMPDPDDTFYWDERVPSGTLREFQRSTLEETAYYAAADGMSKSYARFISTKITDMSDNEINHFIDEMVKLIKMREVA